MDKQLKDLAQKLQIDTPITPLLVQAMQAHGYNEQQQVGIVAILDINNIQIPDGFTNSAETNQWLVDNTQKLLRFGERWSVENETIEQCLQQQKDRFLNAVEMMGMLAEQKPKANEMGAFSAILPGALWERVSLRIDNIVTAIKQGILPKSVIAATGERPLLAGECEYASQCDEAPMMQRCWQEKTQQYPELADIPFELSVAPLKPGEARSNTEDTAWTLAQHPGTDKKNILIFIEQPFAQRFYSIFNTILGRQHDTFLYTDAIERDKVKLFIFQDEIARRIFFQYHAG